MQPRHIVSNHTPFRVQLRTGKTLLQMALLLVVLGTIAHLTFRAVRAQSTAVVIGPGVALVGAGAPKTNASSSKAGSVLFFHKYVSDSTRPDKVNTVLTLTNTNPTDGVTLRLIAVHDCTTEDKFINLAANQSRSFLASKEFPDTIGYLMAVAVTPTGAPTQFNWVIGSATVRDWTGFEGSYNAFALAKRTAGTVTGDGKTFGLDFDGKQYDRLPEVVAADNLQSLSADLTLYSPLPDLSGETSAVDAVLDATVYDAKGQAYTSEINGYLCGLYSAASDIWTDQPLGNIIKSGQPGWASFKAVDRYDDKKQKALPTLGVTFSPISGKPQSGALSLQVLNWLEQYTIRLKAVTPTIASAPEVPSQDQTEPEGGATGMSESKAGSILFYPRFVSGNKPASTLINLTNTHPVQKARVRLFFTSVSPTPQISEKILSLEPQQAVSIKASDVTSGQRGWVMAMAINSGAQAIQFNYLIGSAYVTETSGVITAFNALAVGKNSEGAVTRDPEDVKTALLNFNDVDFDRLPATWALAAVNNQNDFNSYLSYNRLSGSLLSVPSTRGSGSVTVYDKLLAAYGGLIGPAEINLEELAKIRLSPQLPTAATQENAGWLKLSMTTPSLAVISNFASSPIVPSAFDSWTGGLNGSSNLHLLTTTSNFALIVPSGNPGNQAPIAEFEPFDFTTEAHSAQGTVIRLDGTLSYDPDVDDTLTYQWYVDDKLVSTAPISDYRLGIGSHEVKLLVTDTSGETSEPYFQGFEVKDTTAPTISRRPSAVNVTTSAPGIAVTFPLPVAYDAVDGLVTVTSSRPSGSIFPLGLSVVTFTAVDRAGNKATATMNVNVFPGLDVAQTGGVQGSTAPFLANLNNQYVTPGEVRKIVLQAEDADGDPVTFTLLGTAPNVALGSFDPVARKATLFIGPLSANAPFSLVRIQVSDNKQQTYATLPFQIAVSSVPNDDSNVGGSPGGGNPGGGQSNRPPNAVISPLPATIEATEVDGIVMQLNGTLSTDPDLDSLTFSWSDNGTEIAQGVIADVKLGLGTHVITLAVNDGRNATTTATTTIQVLPRALSVKSVSPSRMSPNSAAILVINGAGFSPKATVYITGIGVVPEDYFTRSESSIAVYTRAFGFATQGTRDIIVTNPDGKSATLRAGLTIQ